MNKLSEEFTGDQLAMRYVSEQIKDMEEYDDRDRGTAAAFAGLLLALVILCVLAASAIGLVLLALQELGV